MDVWVLQVAWECPGRAYGGLGTVVTHLAPAIAELGHRVVHVCTGDRGCYGFRDVLCCCFTETIVSRNSELYRGEVTGLSSPCAVLTGGFDYVLIHDYHGVGCGWVAHELGVRLGFFIHTIMDPVLESTLVSVADAVFTNSRRNAERIKSMYGVEPRIVYFPSPYPVEKRERRFRLRAPRLLILTRFQRNKDPGWVLKLLDEVYSKRGGFEVVLAGRGVQLYGYSYPWLRVIGDVSEEEKVELIKSSDLVIYPNIEEPYGMVPLESISLGTPVLVSSGAGVSEVLPPDGLIYPDDSSRTLEVLKYYIGNPQGLADLLSKQQASDIMRKTWIDAAREVLP